MKCPGIESKRRRCYTGAMRIKSKPPVVVLALLLTGCLSSNNTSGTSTASDTSGATSADAGAPVDSGAAHDVGQVTADLGVDTAPETALLDALADALPDIGPDLSSDIGPETALGCCADDSACSSGLCVEGLCVDLPEVGRCWTDAQCGPIEACVGAGICPCGLDCEQWYEGPGFCLEAGQTCLALPDATEDLFGLCKMLLGYRFDGVECVATAGCGCYGLCDYIHPTVAACQTACGLELGCCGSDADCGADAVCIAGDCQPAAEPPQTCWTNADCDCGWSDCDNIPMSACAGVVECPCGSDCKRPTEPGTCVPWPTPEACCHVDEQCGAGRVCAKELVTSALGRCEEEPAPGVCWDASECADGEVCTGALLCPCGTDCGAQIPGQCEPSSGCCQQDADCPNDGVCSWPAGSGDALGRCMWPVEAGQCWDAGDCGTGQACQGAFYCPCWLGCGAADIPGICVDLPSSCCLDDAGCTDGDVCEAISGSLPGTCKPNPNGPTCLGDAQCCWTRDDCGANDLCFGASACGCLDLCPQCGACQADQLGYCGYAQGACCGDDAGCPADWKCVGAGDGNSTGACEPAAPPGRCWSDAGCPAGHHCDGYSTCPCDADCDQASAPGTCLPD